MTLTKPANTMLDPNRKKGYELGPDHLFDGTNIRSVLIDGDPWLFLTDITDAVGLENRRSHDIGKYLLPEDRKLISLKDVNSTIKGRANRGTNYPLIRGRGNPRRVVVSLPGLTSLMIRGNTPKAREFRRWLTHEVIPALYKDKFYRLDGGPFEELMGKFVVMEAEFTVLKEEARILRALNSAETLSDLINTLERDH